MFQDTFNMATRGPMWGWELFFEELSSFLRSLNRQHGTANESFSHYALERIEIACGSLESVLYQLRTTVSEGSLNSSESATVTEYCTLIAELIRHLHSTAQEWQSYLDQLMQLSLSQDSSTSYSAPMSTAVGPGRPKFQISRDQLQYLSSMSFNWTQIANMLGVSRMTIYRRRVEYGLISSTSGSLTDGELRIVLNEIQRDQPVLGETMIWGRFRSMGFHITRSRLREAIRESDPLQRALRWRGELARRQPYSVPGPNSLWHIGRSDTTAT